jgi:hypothetical protein
MASDLSSHERRDHEVLRDPARDGMRPVTSMEDLANLVDEGLFLRISGGPSKDRATASHDYESGLELPGLSVVPLAAPSWWTRPQQDWLARQVCRYVHLIEESDDERYGWLLRGRIVARGPDNEPLLDDIEPLAWLPQEVLDEARTRYDERFDVGEDST